MLYYYGMLIGFDAFIKSLLSLLPLMISIELSELILKTKLKSPYGTRMHYLNPILLFLASPIIPFFIIATQEVFFLLFSSSILMSFLAPFFTIELDSFLEENFPYNYIVKNERINKLFISSLLTSAIIIVIVTFFDFLGIKLYSSVIYHYIHGFSLLGITSSYLTSIRLIFHGKSINYHLKMSRLYFKAALESLSKEERVSLEALNFLDKGINHYNTLLTRFLKVRIRDDVNLYASLVFMNKNEKISYIEKALALLKEDIACIKDFLTLISKIVNKPLAQLIRKTTIFEKVRGYLELIPYAASLFAIIYYIHSVAKLLWK
jgi:hypothetical protein